MNGLGLPGVHVELQKTNKSGIGGCHIRVTINDEEEMSEDVKPEDQRDRSSSRSTKTVMRITRGRDTTHHHAS